MQPHETADRLRSRHPDAVIPRQGLPGVVPRQGLPGVVAPDREALEPVLDINPQAIRNVCFALRDDPDLKFDYLMCLSGVDYIGIKDVTPAGALGVVYHLFSMDKKHKITLRVRVPRDNPVVPTVSDIWPTANWHEREAFDLMGVTFEGHPDHRRILTSDDWVGHPLRKDYEFPTEYHGVPC